MNRRVQLMLLVAVLAVVSFGAYNTIDRAPTQYPDAGYAVVPLSTFHIACSTIDTAAIEADMAPQWYLDAGRVLEACGNPQAKDRAEVSACEANRRNGYECGGAE